MSAEQAIDKSTMLNVGYYKQVHWYIKMEGAL